jgi:hypothetical protein
MMGALDFPPVRAPKRLFRASCSSRNSFTSLWCPGVSVSARAEARPAGEPARFAGPYIPDRATFVAGTAPYGFPRWLSNTADPTGTCSRGSVGPEGPTPGATSSGLSSSCSRGDSCRAFYGGAVHARGLVRLDHSCPRTRLVLLRRPPEGVLRRSVVVWLPFGQPRPAQAGGCLQVARRGVSAEALMHGAEP